MLMIVVILGIALPIYAAWLAWSSRRGGWLAFLMRATAALGVMGFLTLVLRWDLLSVHLVWFWWAVVIVLLALSLLAMRSRGWIELETRRSLIWSALDPIIALGLFGYVLTGLFHDRAVDLASPLQGVRYVVGQGGNNPLINYHNVYPPQRYAIDIIAVDDLGRRATGIEPDDLEAYVIYGAAVVAPCDGDVFAATDGIADSAIGSTNREQVAGNHVVIACHGVEVTLAHLRPGTVAVSAGDTVDVGQTLGQVGNSGNSTEPHLHIHAVPAGSGTGGEGVAMTIDGRFPVRNMVFGT